MPVEDGVPDEAVVAAVEVARERVEVERDDVAAAGGQIEDGGAANELFFAPGLTADDERNIVMIWAVVAPFEDDAGAVLGGVEASGAVGHAEPAARRVVEREILAEDVGAGRIAVSEGMIGALESDADVGTGSARGGVL